jgi:protein SCO1/2
MPKPTLRRLSLALSFAVLSALPGPLAAQAPTPAATPTFTPEEVGIDEHLGATIPLDLLLKAEDGTPVTLRQLVDKPTVFSFNYFRCAGICTPQLGGVAEVLNRTQAEPGKDFQVITISFDERDEPEVAAQKRSNYLAEIKRPFPAAAWRFLTGPGATTKALTDAVGFKFKRDRDDFIHAAALIFVSPQGRITRYMYGTEYLPADFQMAAQEAARGQAQPTINKFLKFCFSYDPVGRKFVVNATAIGAIVVLLGAAIFLTVLVLKGRKNSTESKERP